MSLTTGQSTMNVTNTNHRQSSNTTTDTFIKQEPLDLSLDTEMTTVTVTRSTNPQTLLKQPTIILATTSSSAAQNLQQQQQILTSATSSNTTAFKQERLVLPKVEIKMEPQQQLHHQTHHLQSSQHLHQQQQQQAQPSTSTTRFTHSLMNSPEHTSESEYSKSFISLNTKHCRFSIFYLQL